MKFRTTLYLAPILGAAGFGLAVLSFSYLPIFILIGLWLAIAITHGIFISAERKFTPLSAVKATAAYGFFAAVIISAFTNVKREIVTTMTWSDEGPSSVYPGETHILLRFKSNPACFIGTHSRELKRYLENSNSREVKVCFTVTKDFGSVRAINCTSIGSMNTKHGTYVGSESQGNTGIDPYDVPECD